MGTQPSSLCSYPVTTAALRPHRVLDMSTGRASQACALQCLEVGQGSGYLDW